MPYDKNSWEFINLFKWLQSRSDIHLERAACLRGDVSFIKFTDCADPWFPTLSLAASTTLSEFLIWDVRTTTRKWHWGKQALAPCFPVFPASAPSDLLHSRALGTTFPHLTSPHLLGFHFSQTHWGSVAPQLSLFYRSLVAELPASLRETYLPVPPINGSLIKNQEVLCHSFTLPFHNHVLIHSLEHSGFTSITLSHYSIPILSHSPIHSLAHSLFHSHTQSLFHLLTYTLMLACFHKVYKALLISPVTLMCQVLEIQLIFIICRLHICQFIYLLKFACNPKIIPCGTSVVFANMHREARSESPCNRLVGTFPAEVHQGNLCLLVSALTVRRFPFQDLVSATFFWHFCVLLVILCFKMLSSIVLSAV